VFLQNHQREALPLIWTEFRHELPAPDLTAEMLPEGVVIQTTATAEQRRRSVA
jgi:hypothetical protein